MTLAPDLIPAALLMLADGRFPSGGHANSCGVESAVQCRDVVDIATLERFLVARLSTSGVTDAAFGTRACSEALADDPVGLPGVLDRLDEEYDARTASPRLRSVSRQLGRQLCRSARTVWPHPALGNVASLPAGRHHPIVLGLATAAAGGSPQHAALLTFHHTSSAVATAAVRMLGLDPIAVAAMQARASLEIDTHLVSWRAWAKAAPDRLPGFTGTLTEILGEAHGHAEARLFVA